MGTFDGTLVKCNNKTSFSRYIIKYNREMNYTNANDPNYQDRPEDWLNSSLIFARTLSLILREREGVVVNLVGDVKFQMDESVEKVIVFRRDGQIVVTECEEDLEEGQFVMLHDENPN